MNSFVDAKGKPIPEMPIGTAKANTHHLTTGTSYFFKKRDGSFIAADARDASNIFKGVNQTINRYVEPWQYVGRTDGSRYIKAVKEAYTILSSQGKDAFEAALDKALKDEYKLAKKDKTPPPSYESVDRDGRPISLSTYGKE